MAVNTVAKVYPWQNPTAEALRGRFFGLYLGFVRDRDDPQMMGRVRVHVPSILGAANVADHWLDWCHPKSGATALHVPPLGAPVWVEFEQGQVTHGVYAWGPPTPTSTPGQATGQEDPSRLTERTAEALGAGPQVSGEAPADPANADRPPYPLNTVFRSERGHLLEIDDTPEKERLRYRHPSGTQVLIDPDGSVHIESAGGVYQRSAGDHTIMLEQGATFRVLYPGGAGLALGASGLHVQATQVTLMGRAVKRGGGLI